MKKALKLILLPCITVVLCAVILTACNDVHTHAFGEWSTVKAPTCTEQGEMQRTCTCGEKETKNIATVGHSFGEWKTVKEATCTEQGKKQRTCTVCGEKETESVTKNTNHDAITTEILNASYETQYSELYSLYLTATNHKAENGCNIDAYTELLLKYMLYGKWSDADGNYITYTYIYEDYGNTSGTTWYGTNLPTSKVSGNTYYYYTKIENGKLVIGYEDKITEEKTDNFVITFGEHTITVANKIYNSTYVLSLNDNYDKVQKGNARLAYIYIAKKIFTFKNPSSVEVTACHVDYETRTVYATIRATNSYGGIVSEDYKLYESGGKYYITEYEHNYSTNIDLDELNEKLQAYVDEEQ